MAPGLAIGAALTEVVAARAVRAKAPENFMARARCGWRREDGGEGGERGYLEGNGQSSGRRLLFEAVYIAIFRAAGSFFLVAKAENYLDFPCGISVADPGANGSSSMQSSITDTDLVHR
jgi:hypothetical protein